MKVSVFGLGYVGAVSAACLAKAGRTVIGVDVNPQKVHAINSGEGSVIETGLDELTREVSDAGRLSATLDTEEAVCQTDASMICVGTPSNGNGSLSLKYIESVSRGIGAALAKKQAYHVVIVRSTVLPETVEGIVIPILEEASGLKAGEDFGVCMNPEFLRESSAIEDFFNPCHVIVGQFDERSGDVLAAMYEGVEAEIVRCDLPTAEMVKYVNNAWHALKVVFANEIGSLCKAHEIDGRKVMDIFCRDDRLNISKTYLRPGFAYGGSCLPKDLRALTYKAKERDVNCPVLSAVSISNDQQISRAITQVEKTGRKKIGVLGLSFKAGTDDVRESPIVPLIETLIGRGYEVVVYDEYVKPDRLFGANKAYLDRELPHIASAMRPEIDQVMAEAEVIVIANSSAAFRAIPDQAGDDQIVIDLVGSYQMNGHPTKAIYDGICW